MLSYVKMVDDVDGCLRSPRRQEVYNGYGKLLNSKYIPTAECQLS